MGYETFIVHSSLERWLNNRDYDFQHEVEMPLRGRADFVATNRDTREVTVFECKRGCEFIKRTLAQTLGYQAQLKCEHAVIVVPLYEITNEAIGICEMFNVQLMGLRMTTLQSYTVRCKLKATFG